MIETIILVFIVMPICIGIVMGFILIIRGG